MILYYIFNLENKKMKIVLIEWLDSKEGPSGWEYREEVEPLKPVSCKSVGFLIGNNKKYKTLVSTISKHQILSRITIPSCSIINYRVLSQ